MRRGRGVQQEDEQGASGFDRAPFENAVSALPTAALVGIEFHPLRSKDIIKSSVYEVRLPTHVLHPNLGLPNFELKCLTCGQRACPGHPGHIRLPAPAYHPLRISAVVKILKSFCIYCFKLNAHNGEGPDEEGGATEKEEDGKAPVEIIPDSESDDDDAEEEINKLADEVLADVASENMEVIPDSESEDGDQNAEFQKQKTVNIIPDSETGDKEEGRSRPCKVKSQHRVHKTRVAEANPPLSFNTSSRQEPSLPDSGKCNCRNTHPKVEFKVLKRSVASASIQAIIMKIDPKGKPDAVVQKRLFPIDWNHFEQRRWRSKLLQPYEALQFLRTIKSIKMGRPEDYFIDTLYVAPNAMRIQSNIQGPSVNFQATSSTALRALLKKIKSATFARDGRPLHEFTDKECLEVQACVGQYLRTSRLQFGDTPSDASKPPSGLRFLRKTLAKKTSSASVRGVIRGDPYISTDEVGIPAEVALQMGVPETVTKFNLQRWQEYVDNRDHGGDISVRRAGKEVELKTGTLVALRLGDEVSRSLVDGDRLFINRPPTFHKHALISLKAKLLGEHVLSLNPLLCTPMFADFDGDAVHAFVSQSREVEAEISELLAVDKQLVSSQGGNCIIGMIQDSLLGAYLLTRQNVFLRRVELDQLCMWCEGDLHLPLPAIIKSPKGPIWTGKQVYDMTLPRAFNYENGDVTISGGNVLRTHGSRSTWLGRLKGSVMCAISESYGPEQALHHLNSIQRVLNEWLSQRGFTAGLKDFYLVGDILQRRKLEEEVLSAVEEAKAFSLLQGVVGDADVHMNSVVHHRRRIWTGNAASGAQRTAEAQRAAICGFETVIKDLEWAVKRHASKDNAVLRMINAGSKGSVSKMVHQGACLGLQLRQGRFHYDRAKDTFPTAASHERQGHLTSSELWKFKGLVRSSFLDGLDPHEFFIHSISSRTSNNMMKECSALFRFMMCYLKDLHADYDGSVRSTYGGHLCQFHNEAEPGDPVGALAGTAVIEPIYDMVMSSSSAAPTAEHPLQILRSILEPGSTNATEMDKRVILRLSKTATLGSHGPEWVALKVQDHLKPITLRMITSRILIRYDSDDVIDGQKRTVPWIGYFELHQEVIRRSSIDVRVIPSLLNDTVKDLHFYSSKGAICFFFTFSHQLHDFDVHQLMIDAAFPALLDKTIKGCATVESATIKWDSEIGELIVQVTTKGTPKRGSAWNIVREACLPIMSLVDWRTSSPYSVQEIQYAFGIEAAFQCMLSRLKSLVRGSNRKTRETHLKLIAEAACHSGNVLGFKSLYYEEFLENMSGSSPLSVALGKNPRLVFDAAAMQRSTERFEGSTEAIFFGKRPSIGTGTNFQLFYNESSLAPTALFNENMEFDEFLKATKV